MGSNVLIYDPRTNYVEDLGIPVPRESIYGAKYLPNEDAIFFITYFRGHAYKMDLKTRTVTDFGQCTESGTYLLHEGPDGNIYFSSRMGALWCYDSKKGVPEYLGIKMPVDNTLAPQGRNCVNYAVNGPDGKIYMCTHPNTVIYSFDPANRELKEVCRARIPEILAMPHASCLVFGLQFDVDGVLWFTATSGVGHTPLRLCSFDIKNPGSELKDWGGIGTIERANFCIEGLYLKDNVLYLPDANGPYSPGVAAIDLRELKAHEKNDKTITQDPQCYHLNTVPRCTELYNGKTPLTPENLITADDRSNEVQGEYSKNNPLNFRPCKNIYATKLWQKFGPEGTRIDDLCFDKDGSIVCYISKDGGKAVTIRQGKILNVSDCKAPEREITDAISDKFKQYTLPSHPGRQFLAKASAYGVMADGITIVGTLDGGVALIKDDKVFSLGMVCNDGAIHDIAVTPDGKTAYGVGGDRDSLGTVFSYDAEFGLRLRGFISYGSGLLGDEITSTSFRPRYISISDDGKRMAIGVIDELATVYEYEFDN